MYLYMVTLNVPILSKNKVMNISGMLLVKLQVKANFLELFKMYGRHSIKNI